MPRGRPKKRKIIKELVAEDWCFVCKDGGELLICEYKECLKAYHPRCVEKDDSILGTKKRFECPWHTCIHCSKHASRRCYTCPYAACYHCVTAEEFAGEFAQVKGQYGFCENCVELVLLIEEDKNDDPNKRQVDFKDRNSVEGLFMEYYTIIKKGEGFESRDLHAAVEQTLVKNMDVPSTTSSENEEFSESDEEDVSDFDCMESRIKKRKAQKGKNTKRCKTVQTPLKSSKIEFSGWASKPLTEFLSSIGKYTAEKISQHDVLSIINQYIKEKNLFVPNKKKFVDCDDDLQSLFKKKRINKNKVNVLLEPHLAENQDNSEDDESVVDSDSSDVLRISPCKNRKKLDRKKLDVEHKCQKKELGLGTSHYKFASISVENIQHVYLNKGLVCELLKKPESFEEKVIGSFVRVKSHQYDYQTRNSHQLKQVKGIKPATIGEYNIDTVLLFSTMHGESRIKELSDGNVTEAECEELRLKILAGLVERPTVVELEQKARILHKDKIKHWIPQELSRLKNLICHANEKGWRRELHEYLEKRDKLETPTEQARLLDSVPKVIPDISGLESNYEDINNDMKSEEDSPRSILQCNPATVADSWQKKGSSEEELDGQGHASYLDKQNLSAGRNMPDKEGSSEHLELPEENVKLDPDVQSEQGTRKNKEPSVTKVISLLDDNEDGNDSNGSSTVMFDDVDSNIWYILGPENERKTCSLSLMKRWSQATTYAFQFKVWRNDQKEEDAIWLREAIDKAFPEK